MGRRLGCLTYVFIHTRTCTYASIILHEYIQTNTENSHIRLKSTCKLLAWPIFAIHSTEMHARMHTQTLHSSRNAAQLKECNLHVDVAILMMRKRWWGMLDCLSQFLPTYLQNGSCSGSSQLVLFRLASVSSLTTGCLTSRVLIW